LPTLPLAPYVLLLSTHADPADLSYQPGPPHHPIWGHLLVARECSENLPPDIHPHVYANYLRRKYNLGKFFYLDFWPFGEQFLFIADPEVANQITVSSTLRKSPLETDYMNRLLGMSNMVGLEGAAWKVMRAMFNPGFASGHLMTLLPYIIDATVVFGEALREKARSGELFEMEELATRLTVDVVGKVTLDVDLNSQHSDHRIMAAFRKQAALLPVGSPANPFKGLMVMLTSPRIWYNGRKLDRYIGEALDQRYAMRSGAEKEGEGGKKKTRYAVDLALETYQRDFQDPGKKSGTGEGMDPTFRKSAIAQFKTFIFAGHDTTSSVTAWVYYLLHQHPDVHAKVVEELDSVLGPTTTSSAADKIRAEPYLINRLPYTTAVIKETMRLFPPGSTIRLGNPSVNITDPDPSHPSYGQPYPTAGFHVWVVAHAIHRNEVYFPKPATFVPERHLENPPNGPPFPDAKQHRDALRPFEKGPRNCIGQELAMIEIRVIIALTVGEFDFEAEYPEVGEAEKGKEESYMLEGHRCYQVLKGSAKPKGGLPGRIRLR